MSVRSLRARIDLRSHKEVHKVHGDFCKTNVCGLIIKANKMHCFSNLFLIKNSTCFGHIYCPSSGVSTLYTQQHVFVMLVMLTVC